MTIDEVQAAHDRTVRINYLKNIAMYGAKIIRDNCSDIAHINYLDSCLQKAKDDA